MNASSGVETGAELTLPGLPDGSPTRKLANPFPSFDLATNGSDCVHSLSNLKSPLASPYVSVDALIWRKLAPNLNVCRPTNFERLPFTAHESNVTGLTARLPNMRLPSVGP